MCPLALLESLALNLRAVDNYTEVLVRVETLEAGIKDGRGSSAKEDKPGRRQETGLKLGLD